jgi:predicted alpha/beta-fold hydrolase
MPYIESDFKGSSWLNNKHLETILPALLRKQQARYKRIRITTPDNDFFDVDTLCLSQNENLILLIHGLEGSSQSSYIKGFANYYSKKGFDVIALNFRSCSGELNLLPSSYHSGFYHDLDYLLKHSLTMQYKNIIPIGFSLGGNMLLHYLGIKQAQIPTSLKAALAFSVPIDLAASSHTISQPSNMLYLKRFLRSLTKKMIAKAAQFPHLIDISNIHAITNFESFDNRFTAPLHGFSDANDYYTKVSAIGSLHAIRIPTLLVNAQNDPFLSTSCFPIEIARQSNYLHFEMPKRGGHVGFAIQLPNGAYWSENRADSFIKSVLNY